MCNFDDKRRDQRGITYVTSFKGGARGYIKHYILLGTKRLADKDKERGEGIEEWREGSYGKRKEERGSRKEVLIAIKSFTHAVDIIWYNKISY